MATIFLSKIFGIYFIIIGAANLINPHFYKKVVHEITDSYGLKSLCGSIGLFIGMMIILNHNFWLNINEIIISLIGWIFFILGFVFIFFPKHVFYAGKRLQKNKNWIWMNLIKLLVGIYLLYMGFLNI
jgi:hypothetical protein